MWWNSLLQAITEAKKIGTQRKDGTFPCVTNYKRYQNKHFERVTNTCVSGHRQPLTTWDYQWVEGYNVFLCLRSLY